MIYFSNLQILTGFCILEMTVYWTLSLWKIVVSIIHRLIWLNQSFIYKIKNDCVSGNDRNNANFLHVSSDLFFEFADSNWFLYFWNDHEHHLIWLNQSFILYKIKKIVYLAMIVVQIFLTLVHRLNDKLIIICEFADSNWYLNSVKWSYILNSRSLWKIPVISTAKHV